MQAGEEAGGDHILSLKQLVEGVLAEHQNHSTLDSGQTEAPRKEGREEGGSWNGSRHAPRKETESEGLVVLHFRKTASYGVSF